MIDWFDIHDELNKALQSIYKKHKKDAGKELFKEFKKYKTECIEILPFSKKFFEKGLTLDPIHIYASINYYGINSETRKERLTFLYKVLGLNERNLKKVKYKDTFFMYPHLNIIHLVGMRDKKIQREVWEFFSGVYTEKEDVIKKYFDKAIESWYGLKIASLTVFMFWVNSSKFIPLDQYTEHYLQENFIIEKIPQNFKSYISLNSIFTSGRYSKEIFRSIACIALDRRTNLITSNSQKEIKNIISLYKRKYKNIKDFQKLNDSFLSDVDNSLKDKEKRRKRLSQADKKVKKSRITVKYYHRNPDVVAEVLYKAKGKCNNCHKDAPFKRKNAEPYLEVHHIKPLSKGGDDTVENAEALCPNCHREKHFG